MKKAKKLVVGNWKMNPISIEEAKSLGTSIKRGLRNVKRTQVVLCPPFVYLSSLMRLPGNSFFLGAQNAHAETLGPFTGEISYSELSQFKVSFVILGHSERRKMGESDETINKKVKAVTSGGMTAIICVGENARDRDGEYLNFIREQIVKALKEINKKSLDRIVIAYEPLWAIGAKEAATGRDVHEMSIFIKKVLKDLFGVLADGIKIIYGGSVDRVNAGRLLEEGNVSGLLVGRQSLNAKEFIEIIKLIDSV